MRLIDADQLRKELNALIAKYPAWSREDNIIHVLMKMIDEAPSVLGKELELYTIEQETKDLPFQ